MNAERVRPYVMRGKAAPSESRPTILDKPDPRVPAIYPRRMTPAEVKVVYRETVLDPRLRSTDRCFQRWSVTPGSGSFIPWLSSVRWACVSVQSDRPSALADIESRMVDQAVANSDPWAKQFVVMWYRSGSTAQEIASALRIKRRQAVYDERQLVLAYFCGTLRQMGIKLPVWEAET